MGLLQNDALIRHPDLIREPVGQSGWDRFIKALNRQSVSVTTDTDETITGDWIFQDQITIQDTGGTDNVTMSHDGTDFYFTYTNTRFEYHDNITTGVIYLDGIFLRIYDSTNTDYGEFRHDGTDFTLTLANTTAFNITGAPVEFGGEVRIPQGGTQSDPKFTFVGDTDTGFYRNAADTISATVGGTRTLHISSGQVEVDGATLRVSTGADYADFSHDGTDFNLAFTNTTDYNISGAGDVELTSMGLRINTDTRGIGGSAATMLSTYRDTSNYASIRASGGEELLIGVTTSAGLFGTYSNDDLYIRTNNTSRVRITAAGTVYVQSGNALRVYDSGNTDYAGFSHDGTDFNTDFSGTTDWNITSLNGGRIYWQGDGNRIQLGNDGGGRGAILGNAQHTDSASLNYRTYFAYDAYWDEDNDEWVAARTTLGRKFMMDMGYHNDRIRFRYFDGTVSSPWADSDWSNPLIIHGAAARVDLQDGWALRVYDSGNTDYIAFAHDGTHAHSTFVNTTNFYFNGLTGYVVVDDGAGLLIRDAGNTDYGIFSHDGTDFNMAFTNTVDVNLTGASGGYFLDGNEIQVVDSGSFTGTLTGMTATTQGTYGWKRSGDWVTIYRATALTGTSNATTMTMTGLPSAIQPSITSRWFCGRVTDNGTSTHYAVGRISGGTITFALLEGTTNGVFDTEPFTASSSKGTSAEFSISYMR